MNCIDELEMGRYLFFFLMLSASINVKAADFKSDSDTNSAEANHPYCISWKKDIAVFSAASAGLIYGMHSRLNKPDVPRYTILKLNPDDLRPLDRNATRQKDDLADPISDGIFIGGVLFPTLLYLDKHARHNALPVTVMYLETMCITGMGYSLAAGLVYKFRPYAYNPAFPMSQRTSNNSTYSFYAGHPSMVAAGTFFTAKVFSDLHPDSKLKYALYGVAAVSTLTCGYYRYKGGYHFMSDIATGIGVGTAIGLLVPALHKTKGKLKMGLSGMNQVSVIYSLK